ncbi:MAG: hypothetical protein GF401_03650 [Chitinivibrionales bacterium]|nr:hypothetical protein [Chitinivibrionales bacterium]
MKRLILAAKASAACTLLFFCSIYAIRDDIPTGDSGPAVDRGCIVSSSNIPDTDRYSHPSNITFTSTDRLLIAYVNSSLGEGEGSGIAYNYKDPGGNWNPDMLVVDGNTGGPGFDPVPYQVTTGDKPLLCYYHIGDPSNWTGYIKVSTNNGESWGTRHRLPADSYFNSGNYDGYHVGPHQNHPLEIVVDNHPYEKGALLAAGSRENSSGWDSHIAVIPPNNYTGNETNGDAWDVIHLGTGCSGEGPIGGAFLVHSPDMMDLQIVARGGSRHSPCYKRSDDGGVTWSNSWTNISDVGGSGVGGISLDWDNPGSSLNGWHIIAAADCGVNRNCIFVSASNDRGATWNRVANLSNSNPKGWSDPSFRRGPDGNIHLTFSSRDGAANIKYYVIDPYKLCNVDANATNIGTVFQRGMDNMTITLTGTMITGRLNRPAPIRVSLYDIAGKCLFQKEITVLSDGRFTAAVPEIANIKGCCMAKLSIDGEECITKIINL